MTKTFLIAIALAAPLPSAHALRAHSIDALPSLTDAVLEADAGGGRALETTATNAMTEPAAAPAAEPDMALNGRIAPVLAALGLAGWLGRRMREPQ